MRSKIKLLGHASFKLTVDDKIIYIDPYGGSESDYKEKADLILSSHEHMDHSDPNKIKIASKDSTLILTSSKNAAKLTGNVKSIDPGQKHEFAGMIISGFEAYNHHRFRESGIPFHPKEIQTAFIIEVRGKRIYFAADTDFIEEMKSLKNIDIAILPIGDHYTMDPKEALEAVEAIKPKMVIPMHWRQNDPKKFKSMVESKHKDITVKVLKEGEELDF